MGNKQIIEVPIYKLNLGDKIYLHERNAAFEITSFEQTGNIRTAAKYKDNYLYKDRDEFYKVFIIIDVDNIKINLR
jgi:hypothetical protein